jgi:predicted RNase H-like nuclease (RuvC/YqgF family)
MMEPHLISIIASAIAAVLMLLLGTISWFLREKVKESDTRVARLEDRTREIELEARQRDAEIKQIAEGMQAIGELRSELALRYVSRDELAKLFGKLEKIENEVTRLRIDLAGDRPPTRRRHDTPEDLR